MSRLRVHHRVHLPAPLRVLVVALLLALTAPFATAAYPDRPIQLVVPFAAGSPPDVLARVLAEGWRRSGFAEVVVVNQPGAGGSLAVSRVAKAPPDGHTLVVAGDAALVVNPALSPEPALSPLQDLTPISQLVVTPTLLVVGKDHPARSVAELVAAARAQPGTVSFASAGAGTSSRRNGELLQRAAGLTLTHVPYKTSPLTDVAEGRVTLFFANPATAAPLVAADRLRVLAVAARERLAAWPQVPTMAEAGWPQVDSLAWFGLVGPAGLPPEIAVRLRDEAARVLADPPSLQRLEGLGGRAVASTPAEFRSLLEAEVPRWRAFVREVGLQAD
ncbi:tripartite tricarboxylate transporter substrate binding protein [Aquabacterium sp. J223]|uniref:Bug family tripartite tricarboxylate transporter substrate binding protein n=1 Tax=Aquabacterium sp. J223 TaxID=2898431 RepID=UPI0021ADD5D3|nr:tripartite tricarboxylate transporter substrate binding protein [Aquabacterium sp. J223]UUX97270.1 tripartite tricarboxylate transporter substrate binding protein [Aquabacterium sp. J223]